MEIEGCKTKGEAGTRGLPSWLEALSVGRCAPISHPTKPALGMNGPVVKQ